MVLDGTENQKDTSQSGDTSKGEQGTSEKTPETLTKEQVQEITHKAVSDALSKAGRDVKALEQRAEALRTSEEKHTQVVQARRERELENVRDDTGALKDTRAKHKLEDTNAELAKTKSELDAEREKGKQRDEVVAKTTQEQNAREIATRLNVNEKTLLTLSKHTDGSKEAVEAMAQALPKMGEMKKPVTPDSGKTIGGEQAPDSSGGKMRAGFDAKYPPK
ncbi:hypothetical protein LCGC14_2153910 [marine sediment metagenome]|uniref:Uncharacterized protein n=1 Tax=marine sediment metagenome TaxID=412755 RepID=A0A0F9G7R5_9ZZZZ